VRESAAQLSRLLLLAQLLVGLQERAQFGMIGLKKKYMIKIWNFLTSIAKANMTTISRVSISSSSESRRVQTQNLKNLHELADILDQIVECKNPEKLLQKVKAIRCSPHDDDAATVPLYIATAKVLMAVEGLLRRSFPRELSSSTASQPKEITTWNGMDIKEIQARNLAFLEKLSKGEI